MRIPVLFPKIFDHPFTYKSEISDTLSPGDFVKAPFGSTEITGMIWPYEQQTKKKFRIKNLFQFKSDTFMGFLLDTDPAG